MRKPFFPVGLNLDGRRCVVIGAGGDPEAIAKTNALRESGAQVARIEDASQLRDEDVRDAFFVISTPQDAALSHRLRTLADEHRFLLCCIDQPAYGFVAMTAIAKAGPVRVAISTAGLAPRVGKALKEALQRVMDAKFARFVEHLAKQREDVQNRLRGPEHAAERKSAMIDAARGFEADVSVRYPAWFEESER